MSMSGRLKSSRKKRKTTVIEMSARRNPGSSERKNKRIDAQKGTLGCGVERSRLPHWEQAWAFLGFGCILGQSFVLYERPQKLQKIGSPIVPLLQL